MVMYANEYETKENRNYRKQKIYCNCFFSRGEGGRWGNIKAIFLSKILSISPFLKSNKASFSLRRLTQLELL